MPTRPPIHRPRAQGTQSDIEYRKAAHRFYASKVWRRLRAWYLSRNPLCIECHKEGRAEIATHVDHIRPRRAYPELQLDQDNLQGLCHRHHSSKTGQTDR